MVRYDARRIDDDGLRTAISKRHHEIEGVSTSMSRTPCVLHHVERRQQVGETLRIVVVYVLCSYIEVTPNDDRT